MSTYECTIPATVDVELVLAQLDAAGRIVADHRMRVGDRIHLTLSGPEILALRTAGVDVDRGERLRLLTERTDVGPTGGLDLLSGFVTGYLDAAGVTTRVATLAATFPTLCTVIDLPFPTSGYDGSLAAATGPATVKMLRITTTPGSRSKPGFLLLGGTHAREWMNPLIALEFAEQLLRNVDPTSTDPATVAVTRIVEHGDVLIIPVLNPDGLTYSVHDDAGWRKNRRVNAGSPGCPGTDNNRNYEVYFGGAGSSSLPCSDAYSGPAAMSEPENRNVAWVLEQFPNVLVGVDAHSFGRQILRPNPAGGSFIAAQPVSAADEAVYGGLETVLRTAIQSVNGTTYSVGSTSNHAGTSDEFMFFAHRVFGFNTECGTSFQPAWTTAVPVIAEVVTGLRALAAVTVDLVTTTPTPLSVVQCIDRTGSMVAFGYDGVARANARRFIDLLSLGDSTAVVSFADPAADPLVTPVSGRSAVEFPLTLLDDAGDAAAARTAVDAITFGGWTPIGAGLQRSAALLSGAPAPTAVLLLSDGFENRDPTVASVLPMLPGGLRVFTVALGPAADSALLQDIATESGGQFLLSPTALDLHQVYNEMRAGITDEGLLRNDVLRGGDPEAAEQVIDVEPGAAGLTVSVSGSGKVGKWALIAPSGRPIRRDDYGIRAVSGDGYGLLCVNRPVPGRWRVRLPRTRSAVVLAAFLGSPLRLRADVPSLVKEGEKVGVEVTASYDGKNLGPVRCLVHSQALIPSDRPSDPDAVKPGSAATRKNPWQQVTRWTGPVVAGLPPGMHRLFLECEGALPGGTTFRRVLQRALRVVG